MKITQLHNVGDTRLSSCFFLVKDPTIYIYIYTLLYPTPKKLMSFYLRIIGDDPEGIENLFFVNPSTNIEKVCRLSVVEFDDVHCCHRQTCSIHWRQREREDAV